MKVSIAIIVILVQGIIIMIMMIINFAKVGLIPDSLLPNYSVCFCLREFSILSPNRNLFFSDIICTYRVKRLVISNNKLFTNNKSIASDLLLCVVFIQYYILKAYIIKCEANSNFQRCI